MKPVDFLSTADPIQNRPGRTCTGSNGGTWMQDKVIYLIYPPLERNVFFVHLSKPGADREYDRF